MNLSHNRQDLSAMRSWPLSLFVVMIMSLMIGCGGGDTNEETSEVSSAGTTGGSNTPNDEAPNVTSEATFPVLEELDITFAEGLAHDPMSATPFAVPLKLDMYYPDTNDTNRPVFMFIHGGGFTGGIKHKPEIVDMARYYASRGWVFASIDYRTTQELCDAENSPPCADKLRAMTQAGPEELVAYYRGIAPPEWLEFIIGQMPSSFKALQQGIANYTAQRDAKSALRWIIANADAYGINTDYVTVGGASAGAVTTLALGITNQEDFRDEISIDDDPTLSTTNLSETYDVKSMVYFWGSNAKLDLFSGVYGLEQYDRYDSDDPELFMGHGTAEDPVTPYEEALEMQEVYNDLGVYHELETLLLPNGEPAGHGAWNAQVDGKGLPELSFDFLVKRQGLNLR